MSEWDRTLTQTGRPDSNSSTNPDPGNDVVIIGMSCRVPGGSDYEQYWKNLVNGIHSIRELPPSRWDLNKYYSPQGGEGKSHSKWCGLIDDIDQFDAKFFNISSREACDMDPQQRLLLEETVHCLEDAGLSPQQLEIHKTGVFVGFATADYQQISATDDIKKDTYAIAGNYKSALSNRISYCFNLKGPSLSIDAACASGLIAVHEAVKSLQSGECDYAIVGGTNANLHPWKYVIFSQANMLSRDGLCRTFDINANGYVPGDGAAVVLLQRRQDALRSRNRIVAVIRGSACNHNGRSLSLSAPNLEAQRELILTAYARSAISPRTVTYVEAHGTGTSLGDPIEVEGLNQAFKTYTPDNGFCHIGSVKSNIGHLEGAAGVAGLIKVLMMMRNHWIPQTLHIQTLNPIIDFGRTPFIPARQATEWRRISSEIPLRAGISSFGFTGANSHVLIEESPDIPPQGEELGKRADFFPKLFTISARSAKSLAALVEAWKTFVRGDRFKQLDEADICGTLLNSRSQHEHRYGFALSTKDDIGRRLDEFVAEPRVKPALWWLRIGELELNGYSDIQPAIEGLWGLKEELRSVLDSVSTSVAIRAGSLTERFQAQQWLGIDREVNRLLFGFAYVKTLMKLGFSPTTVDAEGNGIYLGLVISGMTSLVSMVQALQTSATATLKIHWPAIAFYDRVHNKELQCFEFDEIYLRSLIRSATVEAEEVNYYVRQAELLMGNQFSFRRTLEDWMNVARENGLDIAVVLTEADRQVPSLRSSKQQLCFVLAAANALDRVKTKWRLAGTTPLVNEALKELCQLANDEILTKAEVVRLLCGDSQLSYPALLESMRSRMTANRSGDYPLLINRRLNTSPIDDVSSWVFQYKQETGAVRAADGVRVLAIGGNALPRNSDTIVADLPIREPGSQYDVPLNLWLAGVDIRWPAVLEGQNYSKVCLPLYQFDRQRYWVQSLDLPSPKVVERIPERKTDEVFFAEKNWRPLPASPHSLQANREAVLILVNPSNRWKANGLIRSLNCTKAVVLEIGNGTEKIAKNWWRVDQADVALEFADLIAAVAPVSGVIDLSDLDTDENTVLAVPIAKIALLQFLVRQQEAVHVFHFTQRLQAFQSSQTNLAGACFAGLIKMLGAEYKKIYSQTIDIDEQWNSVEGVHEIVGNEWSDGTYYPELIYRKSGRFVSGFGDPQRRPARPQAQSWINSLNSEKTVVITGGVQGLGLEVAKLCADHGVRRLALFGVSPVPAESEWEYSLTSGSVSAATKEKIRNLLALKNRGVKLLVFTDGLHTSTLRLAHQKIRQNFGPIHGVIHAAGIVNLAQPAFLNKPIDSFLRICEPKIRGLLNLHEVLRQEPLECFIVFSSVAAAVPRLGSGFSDYAMANSFMDRWVEHQVLAGHDYFRSIQWLNWTLGRMSNQKGRMYDDLGLLLVSGGDGIELLSQHGFDLPATVLAGVRSIAARLENACLIDKPDIRTAAVEAQRGVGLSSGTDADLQKTATSAGKDYAETLVGIFAAELRVPAESIEADTSFADLGLDSIILAALVKKIENELAIILEPWILIEFDSITKLNRKLQQMIGPQASTHDGGKRHTFERPYTDQAIAVIGVGCHFPGGENKESFWSALQSGRHIPEEQISGHKLRGLSGIETFDEAYFELSHETALHLDPAARQILETAAEAIHDAEFSRKSISGMSVGVFIGAKASAYQHRITRFHKTSVTGIGQNFIAAHLSQFFNLKGPCLVVDAGTKSSTSSLNLAIQSLRKRECELALAGGVDILLDNLADFSPASSEVVWGEGAGCVVLKPLDKAVEDGDRIYAVLNRITTVYGRKDLAGARNIEHGLKEISAKCPEWKEISAIELVNCHEPDTVAEIFRETLTEEFRALEIRDVESFTGRLSHAGGIAAVIKLVMSLHHCALPSGNVQPEHSRGSSDILTAGIIDGNSDLTVLIFREFKANAVAHYKRRITTAQQLHFNRTVHWLGEKRTAVPAMFALQRNGAHYECKVNADNLILRDHLIYGIGVLPGVTYLDLAYRALIADNWDLSDFELRKILFAQPLTIEPGTERIIQIQIESRNPAILTVRSYLPGHPQVDVHMTCDVWRATFSAEEAFDGKLSGPVDDLDAGYSIMRKIGIRHGEFMKGIGQIYDLGTDMAADVRLSDQAKQFEKSFFLHPVLLDAATIVPFVFARQLSPSVLEKPYIPMYMERFRAFKGIHSSAIVKMRKRSMSHPSEDVFYSDIRLFSGDGELGAVIERLCVKQIRSEASMTRSLQRASAPFR